MANTAENIGLTVIGLVTWSVLSFLFLVLLKPFSFGSNLASAISSVFGFVLAVVLLSYAQYRRTAGEDTPSFLEGWRLMIKHWWRS